MKKFILSEKNEEHSSPPDPVGQTGYFAISSIKKENLLEKFYNLNKLQKSWKTILQVPLSKIS